MKLRWVDRFFAALLAVCILLTAAAFVAESFFGMQLSPYAVKLFSSQETKWIIFRVLAIVLLLVCAWGCVNLALRRGRKTDHEFVEQKTDGGELRVSVKAIEGLVRKSVARHDELELTDVKIWNGRDGLMVSLRCNTAADISIPLAMDAMQKQLKEYILESTGISVTEVLVDVEDAEAQLEGGTYRLNDAVSCTPSCARTAESSEQAAPAEETEEEPAEETVTEQPEETESAEPEVEDAAEPETEVTDDALDIPDDPVDEDEAGPNAETLFEDTEETEEAPEDEPEEEKKITKEME